MDRESYTIWHEEIDELLSQKPLVLFMKGEKLMPLDGFSAAIVHILNRLEVDFLGVDTLGDLEMRDMIKEYSGHSTIPQLFLKGRFLGGCDEVRRLYESGVLMEMLSAAGLSFRLAA